MACKRLARPKSLKKKKRSSILISPEARKKLQCKTFRKWLARPNLLKIRRACAQRVRSRTLCPFPISHFSLCPFTPVFPYFHFPLRLLPYTLVPFPFCHLKACPPRRRTHILISKVCPSIHVCCKEYRNFRNYEHRVCIEFSGFSHVQCSSHSFW